MRGARLPLAFCLPLGADEHVIGNLDGRLHVGAHIITAGKIVPGASVIKSRPPELHRPREGGHQFGIQVVE